MYDDFKTFEVYDDEKKLDALSKVQKEGVSRMSTALLSCSLDNMSVSAAQAINQVTVLRIYHQVVRIVKYLDLMDKLENKLYESIEQTIETMPSANPTTWRLLLDAQERLQKSMVDSQKILAPYMNADILSDLTAIPAQSDSSNPVQLMPAESRERIRMTAKAVLSQLHAAG